MWGEAVEELDGISHSFYNGESSVSVMAAVRMSHFLSPGSKQKKKTGRKEKGPTDLPCWQLGTT